MTCYIFVLHLGYLGNMYFEVYFGIHPHDTLNEDILLLFVKLEEDYSISKLVNNSKAHLIKFICFNKQVIHYLSVDTFR